MSRAQSSALAGRGLEMTMEKQAFVCFCRELGFSVEVVSVVWLERLWDGLRELGLFSLGERPGETLEPLPALKGDSGERERVVFLIGR